MAVGQESQARVAEGNRYMELACRLIASVEPARGAAVVLIDKDLQATFVYEDSLDFATSVTAHGFACTVSPDSDHNRIASRIKGAHDRLTADR